ncbi:MAG: hypothetical protein M1835_002221 [Candelina submexicana]|nr:MAG: hypothetical protein M1835_002221 [Candelina submexicana]
MSSPRLTFLYPHLFKPVQSIERAKAHFPAKASHHAPSQWRTFQTSKRQQQTLSQRYGNVPDLQLPPPSIGGRKVPLPEDTTKSENRNSYKEAPKQATHNGPQKAPSQTDQTFTSEPRANSSDPTLDSFRNIDPSSQDTDPPGPRPTQPAAAEFPKEGSPKPLETVLHMDRPRSATVERHKPPHLEAPPYVHHFDTYTLVRDLEKGGFTEDQSVTAMKAVRGLLALNLEVAQEGMVSKSDVENETYLFRAACSELRTEIQKNRKSESDKMRTERSQLQHEVDILNQKLTQELLTLKDDLKGMFDDRKMAVRMEQRSTESSIQGLNYKITVMLNSDSKSEVEGLRWILTRRAAIAIGTMAFLILGSLRYSSYKLHLQDLERKRTKSDSSSSKGGSGEGSNNDGSKGGPSDPGETAEALANLNQGTSASYVSLG